MAEETGLEPVMSESKSDVLPVTPFPNVSAVSDLHRLNKAQNWASTSTTAEG